MISFVDLFIEASYESAQGFRSLYSNSVSCILVEARAVQYHFKMYFQRSLCGSLSIGRSKAEVRPVLTRSQTSGSSIRRAVHNSALLYGPPPPRANAPLTPEQILELTFMLSQPVDTPLLTTSIARLKVPLSRPEWSKSAHCLCDVHTWFDLRWIDELTFIIGEEIGPRLDTLRKVPGELRSVETDRILGRLERYRHIFLAEEPNSFQCDIRCCKVCSVNFCRACKLSKFFQNANAVRALNICAKGRKQKTREWPEACTWLDPKPGEGWANRWRIEGLTILSDRIVIQGWIKTGGKERLTAVIKAMQNKVLTDKAAIERELAAKLSTQSKRTTEQSVYDEIVERNWPIWEKPTGSTETVNLLRRLGADNDEQGDVAEERRADSYVAAYRNLTQASTQANKRSYSQRESKRRQVSRHVRASPGVSRSSTVSSVASRSPACLTSKVSSVSSLSSEATVTRRDFQTNGTRSARESSHGREAQSRAASYTRLVGMMPPTQSTLSFHPEGGLDQNEVRPSSHVSSLRRSRAHSRLSTDSWAIFNNSPLGRGHQIPSTCSVGENAGARRPSMQAHRIRSCAA